MKKKKPIVLEELSPEELVKYEIAKELGLGVGEVKLVIGLYKNQ